MNSQQLSSNPSSHRTQFARRFVRALMRINNNRPTSPSPREMRQRSQKIKIASYASMASAVGSRRIWSRVILYRLRSRARCRRAPVKRRVIGAKRKKEVGNKSEPEASRPNDLRQLVPGGEAMDFCSLLEETAHYIKSLTTQIQVMQSIAEFYNTA